MRSSYIAGGLGVLAMSGFVSAQTFSAAGADAASILDSVNGFRDALGALNPNGPTSFAVGRREVNWDGAPASAAQPNFFAGDFFNAKFDGAPNGRIRGVEFSTNGNGFFVSSDPGDVGPQQPAAGNFGFPIDFPAFSPNRLFSPVGSVVTEVEFFLPGTNTPALTRGLGVVFLDVELANLTSIEYFDAQGNSLDKIFVEPVNGDNLAMRGVGGFSFAGRAFDDSIIASAIITTGNSRLLPDGSFEAIKDSVVMDDFIFGETQAVAIPLPAAALPVVATLGAIGTVGYIRRRKLA